MNKEIEIYTGKDGQTQVEVRFDQDTVWLNQYQLVNLFESSRSNIVEHIKNIYNSKELDDISICRKFRQVQQEGKRMVDREIEHYNLDVIISVGYLFNPKQDNRFCQ